MVTKEINKKADGTLIIQSVLTFAQFLSKVHVNFPQELFYFLFVFTLTWYLSLFSLQYIANMKVPIIVIIVPGTYYHSSKLYKYESAKNCVRDI